MLPKLDLVAARGSSCASPNPEQVWNESPLSHIQKPGCSEATLVRIKTGKKPSIEYLKHDSGMGRCWPRDSMLAALDTVHFAASYNPMTAAPAAQGFQFAPVRATGGVPNRAPINRVHRCAGGPEQRGKMNLHGRLLGTGSGTCMA